MNLLCINDVEACPVSTTVLIASWRNGSTSSSADCSASNAFSLSVLLLFSILSKISSLYVAVPLDLTKSTIASTSSSETNAPWTLVGFDSPDGKNSISPFPKSFSAPTWSSIVLESTWDDTANAIRDGTFALIKPVITSTEGLCVAITKCIPAALAFWASLQIDSSTSFAATIIKSASSSIIITICGNLPISPSFSTAWLYPFKSLTPFSAKRLYLLSISWTAQAKAPAAFLGSVTTGINRWGIPLYTESSTTFGSTITSLTSLGLALYIILVIIVFIQTDFPEPVEPAIRTCGIFAIFPITTFPATSFPNATLNFDLLFLNSSLSITSLNGTISFSWFGTSIPTACFPGIGASILIVSAAKFNAISSARFAILLTLTPSAGLSSYLVIAGPTETFSTFAWTPKLYKVLWSLEAVSCKAFVPPFNAFLADFWSKFTDGYT